MRNKNINNKKILSFFEEKMNIKILRIKNLNNLKVSILIKNC